VIRRKKGLYRILISLVAAVTLLVCLNSSSVYAKSNASSSASANSSKTDLEDKLASLKEEATKIKEELNQIAAEKKSVQANMELIDQQVRNVEEQISIIDQQIADADAEIALLENEIEQKEVEIAIKEQDIKVKQDEYDAQFLLFQERLVAQYKAGTATSLELLLGAESFSAYLENSEYLKRVANQDRNNMNSLLLIKEQIEEDKQQIENEKADIEDHKATVEQTKAAAESKRQDQQVLKSELNSLHNDAQTQINQLEEQENQAKMEYEATTDEMQKVENEIQALIRQNASSQNSPYIGGQLSWPVPGYYVISCGWMGYAGHTGMDITGSSSGAISGAPFYAAGPGTVIAVVRGYTGYGHYVIVDHGGGTTTLYAHASAIYVEKGQAVNTSTALGAVGSTGNSSGPHLHFEVRINGGAVNPVPYVKG